MQEHSFLTAFGTARTATSCYRESLCPFTQPAVPRDFAWEARFTALCLLACLDGSAFRFGAAVVCPFSLLPRFHEDTSVNFLAMSLVRATRGWLRGHGPWSQLVGTKRSLYGALDGLCPATERHGLGVLVQEAVELNVRG